MVDILQKCESLRNFCIVVVVVVFILLVTFVSLFSLFDFGRHGDVATCTAATYQADGFNRLSFPCLNECDFL